MSKSPKVLGLFGSPKEVEDGTAKPALAWIEDGGELRFEVLDVREPRSEDAN